MPQLRSFSALNKSSAQSIFTRQCTLCNLDGNYVSGVANQYLQIHDKAIAAVNTDVPLKTFLLPNAGPVNLPSIYEILGPIPLANGLSIGISSTEATYTAATATFDIFGEIEEYEIPHSSTVFSGSANSRSTVWTEAQGPRFLYDLTIVNGEGAAVYVMLFAQNTASISDGAVPFWESPALASSATQLYHFGTAGFSPSQLISGAAKIGCLVVLSSTPGTLTESLTANSTFSGHKS